MRRDWGRTLLGAFAAVVVVFLALPEIIVLVVSFNPTQRMQVPWTAFSLRWYRELWDNVELVRAFALSFAMAPLVALCATLLGGMAAYGIARARPATKATTQALFIAPLVVPATALGVALYMFMNVIGLTSTIAGVFISHVVVTLPYTFRTILAAIEGIDRSLEEAAESLGAGTITRIVRLVLPLTRPAIAASMLFATIVSIEEFTITLFVGARSVHTVPIQLFNATEYGLTPTVAAASTLLMALSALTVIALEKAIGLNKAYSVRR